MDEWEEGRTNLLMVQRQGMSDAYCHLQLLRDDSPLPIEELPNSSDYGYDIDGNVLVKNSIFHRNGLSDSEVHGPAETVSGKVGQIDSDYVFAYRCDSWPVQARPWIKRIKRKEWPSRIIAKLAKETGSFLVPVGHRLSIDRDFEWRISPSLTERSLMLSFNITQMKCYVLLKIVKNELIKPHVGEFLTSFQLKTIMFFCVEHTKPSLWTEENLLKCLNHCLFLLLSCLLNKFCPNYIFPGEDLFAGRKNGKEMDLRQIMIDLIKSEGRFLLSITCDGLGTKLYNSIKHQNQQDCLTAQYNTTKENVCFLQNNTLDIIEACEHSFIGIFLLWFRGVLQKLAYKSMCAFILDLLSMAKELRTYKNHPDDKMRAVYRDFFPFVSSYIGSAFASYLICRHAAMSPVALMWLNRGLSSDRMSGRIKLASALYAGDNAVRAADVLLEVEKQYDYNVVQQRCPCYTGLGQGIKKEFIERLPLCANSYETRNLMALCVMYTPQEFYTCPPALRFEYTRSPLEEMQSRDPGEDWMNCAVVDSVICLYYLQYMTYGKLGQALLQQRALYNLESCIQQEDDLLYHPETALNLLGKCMEMEKRFIDASTSYHLSLQKRPTHNAAVFHLRNLPNIMNGEQVHFEYLFSEGDGSDN